MEALKEAVAAQPREATPKETTDEDNDDGTAILRTESRAELKQAVQYVKAVADLRDEAAQGMFELYANLLSVDARYAWNKIVQEQTEACYRRYIDKIGSNTILLLSSIPYHWIGTMGRCQNDTQVRL